jgi:hypothetical protein
MTKLAITRNQFAAIVGQITTPTPITLVTLTVPELRRTGNPYGPNEVLKKATVTGVIGADYEATVKVNQMYVAGVAPTFKAGKAPWGERVNGSLVEHKNAFYVSVLGGKSSDVSYIDTKGQTVEFDKISPYMPARAENKKQADAGLTESQVVPRNYKIASILIATIGDTTYTLTD